MNYKIRVEKGPDKGKEFDLPEAGASLGRSHRNDIAISDETLSRQHCRVFTVDGSLHIADLATVNGSYVNGKLIEGDTPLQPGDLIAIGHTELRLSHPDGSFDNLPMSAPDPTPGPTVAPAFSAGAAVNTAPAADAPASAGTASAPPQQPGAIDLGFRGTEEAGAPAQQRPVKNLRTLAVNIAIGCAVLVLIAGIARILLSKDAPAEPQMVPLPEPMPLAFSYVKTEASVDNIFRYQMDLAEDGTLTVSIDDLGASRRVRKSAVLKPESRRDLTRKFELAAFTTLEPLYEGLPRENTWNASRISACLGGHAATVEVRNHLGPNALRTLREELETFGRNELGLWAFAMSREQLILRANEALENADRFFAERDISRANLFNAIRAYESCLSYLDSLEPKPEAYDLAVDGREKAMNLLNEILDDLNWQADHGTNTRDWLAAQEALRTLLEYIPDRADDRYRAAEKRLLDVESRLRR